MNPKDTVNVLSYSRPRDASHVFPNRTSMAVSHSQRMARMDASFFEFVALCHLYPEHTGAGGILSEMTKAPRLQKLLLIIVVAFLSFTVTSYSEESRWYSLGVSNRQFTENATSKWCISDEEGNPGVFKVESMKPYIEREIDLEFDWNRIKKRGSSTKRLTGIVSLPERFGERIFISCSGGILAVDPVNEEISFLWEWNWDVSSNLTIDSDGILFLVELFGSESGRRKHNPDTMEKERLPAARVLVLANGALIDEDDPDQTPFAWLDRRGMRRTPDALRVDFNGLSTWELEPQLTPYSPLRGWFRSVQHACDYHGDYLLQGSLNGKRSVMYGNRTGEVVDLGCPVEVNAMCALEKSKLLIAGNNNEGLYCLDLKQAEGDSAIVSFKGDLFGGEFLVSGSPGQRIQLMVSTDLLNWHALKEVVIGDSGFGVVVDRNPNLETRRKFWDLVED